MHIQFEIETEFKINSLSDLANFKQVMEHLNMKINKSKLARDMGVVRRTIDKYLNGFIPKQSAISHLKLMSFIRLLPASYQKNLSRYFIIDAIFGSI